MTGPGDYWLAVLEVAAVAAAVGLGAFRLRTALLPAWSGAPARLVEGVAGIGLVLVVGQILGTVHALEEGWLVVGCVVAGLVAAFGAGRLRRAPGAAPAVRPGVPAATWPALLVAGVLAVSWAVGTQESLHRGMYGFDTMWYHGPFAAGFAEAGSTTFIHFTGAYGPLVWFYPQSSELLHAGGILLFGNDFASPLINLGWLGFALLAAWCIGRPFGAAPLTMVAAAIVLGSDPWLSSQPGEGYNDVAALGLLLAAVAILVNGAVSAGQRAGNGAVPAGRRDIDWPVVVAGGAAAGLAMATKLTVAAPVAALTLGLVAMAPGGQRRRVALAWFVPLLALGSYWYLRNLFLVGNPLPSLDLGIFPAPELPPHQSDFSIAHYLGDTRVWGDFFLPGLREAFGVAWPLLLGGAAVGALVATWRGRPPLVRVLGAVAVFAALAYLVTPYGAQGPEGAPRNFEGNLRYAAPALILGMSLPAFLPQLAGRRARLGLLAGFSLLFLLGDAPRGAIEGPYLKAALAMGGVLVGLPLAVAVLWRRVERLTIVLGLGLVVLAAAVVGEREQRIYIESRYASSSGIAQTRSLEEAFSWAREVRGARIATDAFRQYGLYGSDLSNRVTFLGREGEHGSFRSIGSCEEWRRALNAGSFDYVVPAPTVRDAAGRARPSRPFEWTRTDPAARKLRGPAPVFRVAGRFDPGGCPRGA